MSAEIIKASDLSCGYGGRAVLSGLNFAVQAGRITTIAGLSGSGKTTLLKTLTGLIPPVSGELMFGDAPVDFRSEASLTALYRRIGVLYQNGALLNSLTLYENVALPIRMLYPETPESILQQMIFNRLSQVGLQDSAEKMPSELSGGMKKRGALARALILDPDVVFCDEPSSGLDPITSASLDDLLAEMKELFRMTMVVVTHEVRSIERISDQVLLLHDGGLSFAGDMAALTASADPFLRAFFLKKENRNDQ
jgi:phospholipid/cholesterol/gamma-HCH transport system ATP-binding protein